MKTKALISILIAISFFGCKSPTESAQSQSNFSLQKAWIYSDLTIDPIDSVKMSVIDSVFIDSTTIHSGKTNYWLSNNNVIIVDSNGFMTGYDGTGCLCDAFKIPATTGDTVSRHDSIPTKVNGNVEFGRIIIFVENADTSITLPAGTFRCAEFEIIVSIYNNPTGSRGFSFISPTVGLIESDSYTIDSATGKIYLSSRKQLIRTVK